jgi:hypothetical protein
MLAELAAINGAFAIIKTTIANGKELASAGKAISDFVNAKEELQNKQRKKKASVFGNDFEEFMALEKIKKQEADLQSYMQLYGRAGLWPDWVKFQAEARKQRQIALREQAKKKEELKEAIGIFALILISALFILGFAYFVARKKAWV